MAQKIAVLSQKGGTGKTTAVRTLTDVFRQAELDVLAVDLDPQGNLSDYFDVDPEASPTVGDVLAGRAKAQAADHDGIIPANLALAEAELAMAGKMGRELILRKALKDVDAEHDIILIDCPPALGLLTVNALVAADWALLSAEAQYFALQGVEQALQVIELARDGLNPDLQWLGVLFNIADMRTVHSREAYDSLKEHDLVLIDCPPALGLLTVNGLVAADWAIVSSEAQYFALQGVNGALEVVEQAREYYNDDLQVLGVLMNIADMRTKHSQDAYAQLREAFGEQVFETVIRASIAYAESAEKALSILDYRPDLGADYEALAAEVLQRIGRVDGP